MKKITLLAAAAMIVASMSSCKKEYTCECTTTGSGYSASASATAKMTKKDAKAWCEGSSASSAGMTTTCKLK